MKTPEKAHKTLKKRFGRLSTEKLGTMFNKISKDLNKAFAGNKKIIKEEDDGYRTHFYRSSITTSIDDSDFDGKFVLNRSHHDIQTIVPKLKKLLETKKIRYFKIKNDKTPLSEEYKDSLPPIIIYSDHKHKNSIKKLLNELSLGDAMWIGGHKSFLEKQIVQNKKHTDSLRNLSLDKH